MLLDAKGVSYDEIDVYYMDEDDKDRLWSSAGTQELPQVFFFLFLGVCFFFFFFLSRCCLPLLTTPPSFLPSLLCPTPVPYAQLFHNGLYVGDLERVQAIEDDGKLGDLLHLQYVCDRRASGISVADNRSTDSE